MVLLEVAEGVSRVHAARRLFNFLKVPPPPHPARRRRCRRRARSAVWGRGVTARGRQENGVEAPVIHHSVYGAGADADSVVLRTGAEIGCSLVDGDGDGVCLEAPGLPLDLLRRTSFGLLQVPPQEGGLVTIPHPLGEARCAHTRTHAQGSRMRNVKTEYVSCPSCGR